MKPALTVLAALVAVLPAQSPPTWTSAVPGRPIRLPADHASHPEYKLEWWYYTGNLDTLAARRFGYQVTFFRVGVDPAPVNPSRWAVRDLFMTHVALTDVQGRQFHVADRINRAGPGWAGAATDRYRVWNDDWEAALSPAGTAHRLRAATDAFTLDLQLDENRPVVLHGRGGYSQKGASAGNASYYYSLTRMPTRGALTIGGKTMEVSGSSWMDHEFGTSVLESDQVGWDWFSLQLEDGRDLMLFQLRGRNGAIDPHSSGTVVLNSGTSRPLAGAGAFTLQPGRRWSSPASHAAYPVEWRIQIPSLDLEVTTKAVLDDQELRTTSSTGVTYWEGAIDVAGTGQGVPIRGRGYVEMTGYAGAGMGAVMR